MHPYQRGRASITGLVLKIRKIIEIERLVGVVMARLVVLFDSLVWRLRAWTFLSRDQQ
jgi:hypothetical protein